MTNALRNFSSPVGASEAVCLQQSDYFRREKSLVPLKFIHNLEAARGRCMSVSHVLKAFDLRRLGVGTSVQLNFRTLQSCWPSADGWLFTS